MVTYNSAKFIKPCIESIVEKVKDVEFEVVIKDNGSKDSTTNIIKGFINKNPNIKLVESKINNGFAGGNNDAVKFSSGKLLFFLNPDTTINIYNHKTVLELLNSDYTITVVQPKIKKMLYPDIVDVPSRPSSIFITRRFNFIYYGKGVVVNLRYLSAPGYKYIYFL